MAQPAVHMHGPEHHILVGSAIISAFHNCGGDVDLNAALDEMKTGESRRRVGYAGSGAAAVQQSAAEWQ